MADLTSRRDHWTDILPGNLQQSINTNPLLNALGRALQRPSPDLTRGIDYDQHGSVSDRNWLLQAAQGPSWLDRQDTIVKDGANKLGMLASFLGPGARMNKISVRDQYQKVPLRELVDAAGMPLGRMLKWDGDVPILEWSKNPKDFTGSIIASPDGPPRWQWHVVDGKLLYHTPYIDQQVRDWMSNPLNDLLRPRYDHFFRSTNNKAEIDLIRSGTLRRSRNHADNFQEIGLSVADGPHYAGTAGYKYAYPIRGSVIGAGSDGEPLLDIASLAPLWSTPRPVSSVVNQDIKRAAELRRQMEMDRLKTIGLTMTNPIRRIGE